MVQYTIPRGSWEKFPYKSRNFEKASYCASTLLFEKNEKGCVDSIAYKVIKNNSLCDEQKTEIFVWWNDLAWEQES